LARGPIEGYLLKFVSHLALTADERGVRKRSATFAIEAQGQGFLDFRSESARPKLVSSSHGLERESHFASGTGNYGTTGD
jgi:hypothetical protein